MHIVQYWMRGLGTIHWHQGKGVDIILDCIGAPYLEKDLECLAMDGKVVYIGLMGGLTRCPRACTANCSICMGHSSKPQAQGVVQKWQVSLKIQWGMLARFVLVRTNTVAVLRNYLVPA